MLLEFFPFRSLKPEVRSLASNPEKPIGWKAFVLWDFKNADYISFCRTGKQINVPASAKCGFNFDLLCRHQGSGNSNPGIMAAANGVTGGKISKSKMQSTTAQRQLSDIHSAWNQKEYCQNLIFTLFSRQNNLSSHRMPIKTQPYLPYFGNVVLVHERHNTQKKTHWGFFRDIRVFRGRSFFASFAKLLCLMKNKTVFTLQK